jgi:hypothetical protein
MERKKSNLEKTRKTAMKTKRDLWCMQTTSNGTEHRLYIRVRDWISGLDVDLTDMNGSELYLELSRVLWLI